MKLTELRIMGARLFRQEFAKLDEPVVVISRNEIKGVWMPGDSALSPQTVAVVNGLKEVTRPLHNEPIVHNMIGASQADRDAILRKINKG